MYRSLNDQHKVMMSPYYCTMQALFLIKGPAVNDWTNDQVEALVTRVNHPQNPIGCDEEILWTNFGTAFDGTFTNTTKKQKAHATIQQIQMKGDDLDSYIAAFKRLAKEAGYALDAAGTVNIFALGLKRGLMAAILHRDNQPDTMEDWITAA